MFGLTSDEEVGATHAAWQARIHPEDLPVVLAKVRAYQENPSERLECEYRVRHRSGVWIWVLDRGRWLGDAGRQLIVGTLLDISFRKEMEQQLLRMAITDPLTGLSNRRAFNETITAGMGAPQTQPRDTSSTCALRHRSLQAHQ